MSMTHQGYFIEKEDFAKLRRISDRLHSGSDAMRDEGTKLLLVLDAMHKVELWHSVSSPPNQSGWDTWK